MQFSIRQDTIWDAKKKPRVSMQRIARLETELSVDWRTMLDNLAKSCTSGLLAVIARLICLSYFT